MPIRVAIIGGNIGAGKSTILSLLYHQITSPDATHALPPGTQVHVIKEPTADWSFLIGQVYRNPDEYAFHFQLRVLQHFIQAMVDIEEANHKEDDKNEHWVFLERSMYDSIHVFVQHPDNKKHYSEKEIAAFTDLVDSMHQRRSYWMEAHYYYIDTTPEQCYARMKRRSRPGEECVPIEYLRVVDSMYEKMLIQLDVASVQRYHNDLDDLAKSPLDIASAIAKHFTAAIQ